MYTHKDFENISVGMEVYDKDGTRIGTVKAFRNGEGTLQAQNTDLVTKSEIISAELGGKPNLPSVLYERLFAEGFIRVERGFLRRNVVIFPEQVAQVANNSIYLDVSKEELPSI